MALPLLLSSCKNESRGSAEAIDARLWESTAPFDVQDASLSAEEYRAMGVSALDRNWSAEDLRSAALALEVLSKKDPRQLPQCQSARSGDVFEHIIRRDQVVALANPALPISIRVTEAAEYTQSLDQIARLYLSALQHKLVSGGCVVELYGAQLRTFHVVMDQLDEFLPTLAPTDPSYAVRMGALERIRAGLAEVLANIVSAISEPRFYDRLARKKLVGYCLEDFDALVPRLTLQTKKQLLDQLTEASVNRHLANLQPELSRLRDRVGYCVSSAATAPQH
ncbi:MAG TPA: hypothetical protein VKP30_02600 [Polyangiaceae bacterium]|nr:hypothetical protein [Polyangiaceae bacterium]